MMMMMMVMIVDREKKRKQQSRSSRISIYSQCFKSDERFCSQNEILLEKIFDRFERD